MAWKKDWQKEKTPIDTAVDELQRHWPAGALGNFGEDEPQKAILALLEVTCRIAEASPCREAGQSIAGYASSLLWSSHLIRTAAAANAHGMVDPLAVVLTADPMVVT